ncbi:hypothetical protein L218DRAFT_283529 [Marasmius fiardii PR-910]|nr:hypothetical protein L218DRAFT_283529 [Marasmius fiardii PR-910]
MLPHHQPSRSFAYLLLFLGSSHRFLVQGKTVPRLIDDTYGDRETGMVPSYYPKDSSIWQGNDCTLENGGCLIVPEKNRALNGTWMAATYRTNMQNLGLTLQFEGTSISVYFILANDVGKSTAVTRTDCNFILDGVLKKQYSHLPTSQLGLEYNVEVFNATGLENKLHTLEISTGKLDHEVFMNFDYAMYTNS